VFALLLTGPPGAGKSEVASALHDSLGEAGEDAALIEVDALERAALRASDPPIDRDAAVSHLAMLAGSYRQLGTPILIVTATLEDDDYREEAVRALGAERTLLVRLEADPDTLRERILAREPPGWGGLPDLLNASRRLADEMKDLDGVDLVLSTEGRRPAEVAEELEAALRERLG
jgi:predicted kinase